MSERWLVVDFDFDVNARPARSYIDAVVRICHALSRDPRWVVWSGRLPAEIVITFAFYAPAHESELYSLRKRKSVVEVRASRQVTEIDNVGVGGHGELATRHCREVLGFVAQRLGIDIPQPDIDLEMNFSEPSADVLPLPAPLAAALRRAEGSERAILLRDAKGLGFDLSEHE